MKTDNILDFGILKGEITSKEIIVETLCRNCLKVYDVIRIINGKPLYLESHLDRLNRSIKLAGYRYEYDIESFKKDIEKLVVKSGKTNNNIKTTYFEEKEPVKIMYMVKSIYPTKEEYRDGYKTILIYEERENPNAKILNENRRTLINKILRETDSDEAIFISEDRRILEGSRSNLFFVKGEKIITSPDEDVLLGTTRQKIIEICERNNISVLKREIILDELSFFDAAFITGTSIDIMPLARIDNIKYNTNNKVIKRLNNFYDKDKIEYLKNYKRL